MPVQLACESEEPGLALPDIRAEARAILRLLKCSRDELSVLLVDDVRMRELNSMYRGIDRTTDVLAFPQADGEEDRSVVGGPPGVLGDVVISVPTARKQAARRGHSVLLEIRRLLVHGVLHLRGFDHKNPAQAKDMRAEELRLMRALAKG